jgi:hypothetical protein
MPLFSTGWKCTYYYPTRVVVQRIGKTLKAVLWIPNGSESNYSDLEQKRFNYEKILPEFLYEAGGRIAFSPPEQLQKL